MSDSERLNELIEYLKKEKIIRNQQDFVERIGENRSVVSSYANGKRHFSDIFVHRVIDVFPFISKKWLQEGEGDMLEPDTMLQLENNMPIDQETLSEIGGEFFAAKMLELFRKGLIYSYDSYKLQSEEYREILVHKDKEISLLNQEIGRLKAIIEMMKGKSPEDLK